jgi:HTH-type transcriptional regulator, competence development regulator
MIMSATAVARNVATRAEWQTFAQTVKQGRVTRGWPMRTFARMAGISLGYLGLIETARCAPPSDEVLMRMAVCLEIPPVTLFALAGRLPPDVTAEFWQHPAIPPILSTMQGMTLADAQTFCQHMRASLNGH